MQATSPLTVELPEWIDTNYSYELIYDVMQDAWVVLPF